METYHSYFERWEKHVADAFYITENNDNIVMVRYSDLKDNESEFGKIISIQNNFVLAMLKIELADKKIITKKQIKTNEGLILEFIL